MDRPYAEVSDIDKGIAALIGKGVKLWSAGDKIRFSARIPGILTPDNTKWILDHHNEIIASLAARNELET